MFVSRLIELIKNFLMIFWFMLDFILKFLIKLKITAIILKDDLFVNIFLHGNNFKIGIDRD